MESLQRRYDDLVLEKERLNEELRKAKQHVEEMEQLFLQKNQTEGNEEYERHIQELEELVNTLETENRQMRRKSCERPEETVSSPVNEPDSALLEQIKSLKEKVELLEAERENCEDGEGRMTCRWTRTERGGRKAVGINPIRIENKSSEE